LLELVEDLLTVSRLEGSALLLANEPVDLRTIVSSAISGVGLTGRSLTLSWDAPNAEVTVLGDAAQLRRVVSQLLANAVTFTPDGGRIDVNVTSDGRSAELIVSDTGIGIEYEEQRHIFHRFYRPAATERLAAPGSGLGLAISRGVVHQHGGAIRLHSQPGVGTTVTITLPLARCVETESTVAGSAAAPGAVPDVTPEAPEPPAYEEILAGSSRKRGMR
jgi:signal transduction histidine kinase